MRQADFCRDRRGLIFRAAHTGVGAGEYLPFPVFLDYFCSTITPSTEARLRFGLANEMAATGSQSHPSRPHAQQHLCAKTSMAKFYLAAIARREKYSAIAENTAAQASRYRTLE
jgi:hypothetical protein